MTINELLELLKQAKSKIEQANIDEDDASRLELEGLIIQLKRQIIIGSTDPLRDISQMTVVDVSQLRDLLPQLIQVIQDEQRRVALITKIVNIAKNGLRGAGVPISL